MSSIPVSGVTLTLAQIAEMLGGALLDEPPVVIRGVADPRTARPDQITCLGDERYRAAALSTKAGAVLIKRGEKGAFPCPVIEVEQPVTAFAKLAQVFAPALPEWEPGIHSSAVVASSARIALQVHIGPHAVIEADVEIGEGAHIGAGCYIGHGCKIGEGTFLHPRVTLYYGTILGRRVSIHSGTVIGADGFGYEFKGGKHIKVPQLGHVQIDDDVEIGANTTIDRGRFDRTWIQEGCKIDNLVMIAHNCVIGKNSVIVAQVGISGSTHVGCYVTLAGQVGVVGHVTIGDKATVTAQTGVAKSLEPGGIYSGGHARPMKDFLKVEAAIRRLPELIKKIRDIEDKLS